ncbi:MAG: hypothetical protein HQM10_10360 [Candidatus Riflebacteria bacterium]|nr:hypothetical protein [Candidatus Riflebacteria bacterium]
MLGKIKNRLNAGKDTEVQDNNTKNPFQNEPNLRKNLREPLPWWGKPAARSRKNQKVFIRQNKIGLIP